jgi:DNA-binding YbaB/EbfC family protein
LFGNLNALMQQARAMQEEMTRVKGELEDLRIEVRTGGDMVKVVCNGVGDIVSIKIDPGLLQEKDTDMLETLILSAVNEARRRAEESAKDAMKKITGGLPLSSLANLVGGLVKPDK